MLYSPSSRQALRAAIFLASRDDGSPTSTKTIAEFEQIPLPFLSKLMHALQKKGLVVSTMGPGGGYQLARPAEEIQVAEIIDGIDGSDAFDDACALGYDTCDDENGCAFHQQWKALRAQYRLTIGSLTLGEAAKSAEPGRRNRTGSP